MQPPTDNLYKFLSISALLCFLFFSFDFSQRSEALSVRIDDWNLKVALFGVRLSKMEPNIEEEVEAFREGRINLEEFGRKTETFKADVLKVKTELVELEQAAGILDRLTGELNDLETRYTWLKCISLLVFFIGLLFWYVKTQRYLDIKYKEGDKKGDSSKEE